MKPRRSRTFLKAEYLGWLPLLATKHSAHTEMKGDTELSRFLLFFMFLSFLYFIIPPVTPKIYPAELLEQNLTSKIFKR